MALYYIPPFFRRSNDGKDDVDDVDHGSNFAYYENGENGTSPTMNRDHEDFDEDNDDDDDDPMTTTKEVADDDDDDATIDRTAKNKRKRPSAAAAAAVAATRKRPPPKDKMSSPNNKKKPKMTTSKNSKKETATNGGASTTVATGADSVLPKKQSKKSLNAKATKDGTITQTKTIKSAPEQYDDGTAQDTAPPKSKMKSPAKKKPGTATTTTTVNDKASALNCGESLHDVVGEDVDKKERPARKHKKIIRQQPISRSENFMLAAQVEGIVDLPKGVTVRPSGKWVSTLWGSEPRLELGLLLLP
jgi:hypothetical protein